MIFIRPENLRYINPIIGIILRQCRNNKGIDKGELAERMGISMEELEMVETGTRPILAQELFAATMALGVDTEFFFLPLLRPEIADRILAEMETNVVDLSEYLRR